MATTKITFPTIYLKPMTVNEKEAVRDAISDWRADGVEMTDDEATTLIHQWCEQMKKPQEAYFSAMGTENEFMVDPDTANEFGTSWAYDCIFRNSDDVCIGFQVGKFIGTRYHHSMTCIRPAYRNQGYYSELGDQGLKTLFIGLKNVETFTSNVPTAAGTLPSSIYDLYNGDTDWSAGLLRTQTLLDRIDPIEYQLYEVKKSDWLTWLDLPKNAALKAATFSYEKIDD